MATNITIWWCALCIPKVIISENQAFPGNCKWTAVLTQLQSTFVFNEFFLLLLFSGADIIITYYVPQLLDWLKEN